MTLRALTLALGLSAAAAAPILDILADPCSGTAEPKRVPTPGAPVCYQGGMEILGGTWKER